MSLFARLRTEFGVNWGTVLVGWNGSGRFAEPELSREEIDAYAAEQLAGSPRAGAQDPVVELLSVDLRGETREAITARLVRLSDLERNDLVREARKWRLVLLEDLLERLPDKPLDGLIALSDFWNDFGFPSDMPREVRGGKNAMTAAEYFQDRTFQPLVESHRVWVEQERRALAD